MAPKEAIAIARTITGSNGEMAVRTRREM